MRRPAVAALCLALLSSSPVSAASDPPRRIFFSGHSLLDEPLPRDVAAIASSLGLALAQVDRHTPFGSSIRDRLATGPAALPGAGIDTLVVTEQHTLIGNLVWNDSARQLRRLHDTFIAANPQGRTWLYASWLTVGPDLARWIAYERAASPVWQCLAARLNVDLAAEGRGDRLRFLPAGALLASLAERAQRGEVPGVTVAQLFRDDVHLSPLGSYFMSLVVFATLFERSPAGAAAPADVDPAVARTLQDEAWRLVQQERASLAPAPVDAGCGARTRAFVAPYAAYVRDVVDRPRVGPWRAWWLWAKHRTMWQWALRKA